MLQGWWVLLGDCSDATGGGFNGNEWFGAKVGECDLGVGNGSVVVSVGVARGLVRGGEGSTGDERKITRKMLSFWKEKERMV